MTAPNADSIDAVGVGVQRDRTARRSCIWHQLTWRVVRTGRNVPEGPVKEDLSFDVLGFATCGTGVLEVAAIGVGRPARGGDAALERTLAAGALALWSIPLGVGG
jgi:hypothetical protein